MSDSILILGAGVAGLTAARFLQHAGQNATLVDKGRGVGGRVATRRLGERDAPRGRWDHGANFVTFRDRDLLENLTQWGVTSVLEPWLPGHSDPGIMRMRPANGMNELAKKMAGGLTIHRAERIVHLHHENGHWAAKSESGKTFQADRVISTLPMPQFLEVAAASELELSAGERDLLESVHYQRTLTLLAELDGPSGLDEPEGLCRVDSGILELIVDQHQKGISDAHTLVAHAAPSFSLEWYDRDRSAAASVLRAAVQERITSNILSVQIHGWKFSRAVKQIPQPCLPLNNGLVLAGDGFTGDDLHPRIESAMQSGRAAAMHLLS